MNEIKLFTGKINEEGIVKILFKLHLDKLTGNLSIIQDEILFNIIIKNGIIIFVKSKSEANTLGNFLIKQNIITKTDSDKAFEFSNKNNKRFGRSLLELGLIDNDGLWKNVKEHLIETLLSLFIHNTGNYEFFSNSNFDEENITLNLNIPQLLVEGSRLRTNNGLIDEKLAATEDIYPQDYTYIEKLNLKPYEYHILNLIEKESKLSKILEKSELLRFDTLKLIDLFLTMDIITNNKEKSIESLNAKKSEPKKIINENEKISGTASFKSFAEALKYYNNKYELIYKVFSKEIGPISLSILQKSISDVSDNLPVYLRKIKWNSNGTIQEASLLKSMYHKDFHENIKVFLTGLEEILYAGIYTIRKNISPEKEQTILKWINKPVK